MGDEKRKNEREKKRKKENNKKREPGTRGNKWQVLVVGTAYHRCGSLSANTYLLYSQSCWNIFSLRFLVSVTLEHLSLRNIKLFQHVKKWGNETKHFIRIFSTGISCEERKYGNIHITQININSYLLVYIYSWIF